MLFLFFTCMFTYNNYYFIINYMKMVLITFVLYACQFSIWNFIFSNENQHIIKGNILLKAKFE